MNKTSTANWPDDYQAIFWSLYPRRVCKIAAMKALDKIKKRGDVSWDILIHSVEKYAEYAKRRGDISYVKHAASWLNAGCWEDDPEHNGWANGQRGSRALQDDSRSISRAADRLAGEAERGSFNFGPRPGSVLSAPNSDDVRLLPKR